MPALGYKLSSEEHRTRDLVEQARRAEEVGFTFAMISDHYHPWTDRQGQSPFVWSVLGAISQVTSRLTLGTAVTCPTVRIHPAIIAQAAATTATLLPGRFILGLGSGENLNEHILGDNWPSAPVRLEMLQEAVEVIRQLWEGGVQEHYGLHYTVENAQIYTLPEQLPPIMIAAEGPMAVNLAADYGEGLITTSANKEVVQGFKEVGGEGKPVYAEISVCWAQSEEEARRIAYEIWPIAANKGQLNQELPLPSNFESVAQMIRQEDVAKSVICGPDPQRHIEGIRKYFDTGIDHVFVHQIGPDQEGFFNFYQREILPALQGELQLR